MWARPIFGFLRAAWQPVARIRPDLALSARRTFITAARVPALATFPQMARFVRLSPLPTLTATRERSKVAATKMKAHSGAKKRIKVMGNGDLKRGRVNRRHLLITKNSKRMRRLRRPALVHKTNYDAMARLLNLK